MDWMTRLESHSSGIQASNVLRATGPSCGRVMGKRVEARAPSRAPSQARAVACSDHRNNSPGDEYTFECQARPRIFAACLSAVDFGFSGAADFGAPVGRTFAFFAAGSKSSG